MTERPGIPVAVREALEVQLEAEGFGADDRRAAMEAVDRVIGPEIAMLQARLNNQAELIQTLQAGELEANARIEGLEAERDHYRLAFARLRRIEAVVGQVLASGQARYDTEEVHAGDLVPATAMQSLRDAVDGPPGNAGNPPAALDYAERLGLALLLGEAVELLDPDAADDARRACARRLIETADQLEAGESPHMWTPEPPAERGWHRRWVVIRRKGRDPRPRIAMVKNEPPARLRVSLQGYPTLFAEDVLLYGPRVPCTSVPSGWRQAVAELEEVRDA